LQLWHVAAAVLRRVRRRARYARLVNQTQLSRRVVERLEREACDDPLAWVPAVGWLKRDGHPYGLGVELFGEAATVAQLDVLAKVLFRLAADSRVEIARFRRKVAPTDRLAHPQGDWNQAYLMLAGPGSTPLGPRNPYEYGARLAVVT
jgi:hypothetical protein